MPGTTGLTESQVARAVGAAYAALRERGGLMPHAVIEDLVGLDAYRQSMGCPDTETLAAYAGDTLLFEEALRVAVHENRCPVCRADVADLREVVCQDVTQLLSALPAWTTPFVGREALRESLAATLARGDAPLVTLAAPPGMGKTRLMLETAVEQSCLFPDGVWYVPVGDVGEGALAAEIARAVRLTLSPRGEPAEQIQEFFAGKRALLVLDDVPARSPAAGMLAALAGAAPELRCLLTTSGALGVAGERAVPLPPLQFPGRTLDPEALLSSESVRLFAEHLRAVRPGYAFDEPDLVSAAAICERAAGMPLGIELAASRAREMSPGEILKGLAQPRRGVAPPGGPSESLQELMAWSYDLLSPRERDLVGQLSLFEDGFTAEQAAAVCRADDAPEILDSLHAKALLQRSDTLERPRYRQLAPIREFARRRLPADRARSVERGFAVYFLDYARERADALGGPRHIEAMEDLSVDLPNLRAGMDGMAAIARAGDDADAERATGQWGLALHEFLLLQGFWQECEERLRTAVDAFRRAEDPEGRAQAELALARCLTERGGYDEAEALLQAVAAGAGRRDDGLPVLARARRGGGNLAWFRGRYNEAATLYDRALRHFEVLGDARGAADCWHALGVLALDQGDSERAERLLAESVAYFRKSGDRSGLAQALVNLGNVARDRGRLEDARRCHEEGLQLRQELGDVRGVASSINALGILWQDLGDHERAQFCYAEAARRFEQFGDRRGLAIVGGSQGTLAREQNDTARARGHFEAALRTFEALGDAHDAARTLEELGRVAEQEGRGEEAFRLFRESLSRFRAIGDVAGVALGLYRYARLLARSGDEETAAVLLNAALIHCTECRRPELGEVEAALRSVEERIGAERAGVLRARALSLTLEQALSLALGQ